MTDLVAARAMSEVIQRTSDVIHARHRRGASVSYRSMTRGCIAGCVCLMLAACGGSGAHEWSLVGESSASWMAVWGTASDDVWVVGGRRELAGGPQVGHYDGAAWSAVDVGQTGFDLWWVFGVPGSDTHYFGGSNGTILRHRAGAFEAMPTPGGAAIVFGIWGSSDTDLWAVGAENGVGFAWRGDGTTWTSITVPAEVTGRLFKVHGQAANDVWISAAGGSTLHWDGSALTVVPTGSAASLFSVVTTPGRAITAGGIPGEGTIFESTGGAWTAAPVASVGPWRGVAAGANDIYVVGELGTVAHHDGATWSASASNVQKNFHAAWIDPDGGLWGVGGDFDRVPLTSGGFVNYLGSEPPRSMP